MHKERALFGGEEVAVDGSFFKANAGKQGIYTEDKLKQQLAYLDKKIADYQHALAEQDRADDAAGKGSLVDDEQLQQKLDLLQAKQAEKKALQQQAATARLPPLTRMPGYSVNAGKLWPATMCKSSTTRTNWHRCWKKLRSCCSLKTSAPLRQRLLRWQSAENLRRPKHYRLRRHSRQIQSHRGTRPLYP